TPTFLLRNDRPLCSGLGGHLRPEYAPIMPRLYIAIHKEDTRPIIDIMHRTPEIPAACQWAIFLRNHDELTLEMVTDEEREYMYRAYTPDPAMRINVGIRRRLAPLMEYSRPRIELMNALLFSLPGTPIVYYGDEIGMGENYHLADRNGVRTPMQWSADINGGFSAAPAEQLYSPVIADPIAGYKSVNVESQSLNPSSLLNWMRKVISIRKQYKVFGRGSVKFLESDNHKVLAYLRRYENQQVLIVANFASTPQVANINLAELSGTIPLEIFGMTQFPPVGDEPYRLMLGAYGFYWLDLSS
ncbi:MAG: alpha-glucosidase C-terminal domain-containing protein, partial [Candidatus Obscuribacterales bacterium]|nr:alpha-glucosidase C-terminal domain-containing protein [Candidatus Obscuribacterales bacterium]